MRSFQRMLAGGLIFGFLLGSYKGYVALWDEDDPDPIQIFPVPLRTLPEKDRAQLEKGIYARSETELNQFLEDFLS